MNEAETANGYQDTDGCPDEVPTQVKKFTGIIQGINFKLGSAEILRTSNKTLDAAVKIMSEFGDLRLEIAGHTDDAKLKKGSVFTDNDALSQARADAVKAYFVSKGIDESRLTSKGYGSNEPIDPGKNSAARAKNRRVEFKLVSDLTGDK
jgi:OOP family OmpA-OmpF porin